MIERDALLNLLMDRVLPLLIEIYDTHDIDVDDDGLIEELSAICSQLEQT